jgi:hypothetical protein
MSTQCKCEWCGVSINEELNKFIYRYHNNQYLICWGCFTQVHYVRPEDKESFIASKVKSNIPVKVKSSMGKYNVVIIIGCVIATIVSLFMEYRNEK